MASIPQAHRYHTCLLNSQSPAMSLASAIRTYRGWTTQARGSTAPSRFFSCTSRTNESANSPAPAIAPSATASRTSWTKEQPTNKGRPHSVHSRCSAATSTAEPVVDTSAGVSTTFPSHSHLPAAALNTRDCDPRPVTAAYIHLPFCKRKCFYCDFPVVAVGAAGESAPGASDRFSEYTSLLLREIGASSQTGPPGGLNSVFFGGGTPSLIPPPLLGEILAAVNERFGIADGAEISMEADPGTFDEARLQAYMSLGVNRFSVGVQAFQQPLLESCGRSHNIHDIHAALGAVHSAGPTSWSLDLIAGLPGLTREMWTESILGAIAAKPPHISIYDLQVEEGTPFEKWYPAGTTLLPQDEDGALMYEDASRILQEAGYDHYEVCNYALPGHQCRHNVVYWHNEPYYAFGLGAASNLQHRRFARPRKMAAYRAWVEGFTAVGGSPGGVQEPQSLDDELLDTVMLNLRLAEGLDMATVTARHGAVAADIICKSFEPHIARGLVARVENGEHELREGREGYSFRLTDPTGFLLSNDVISDVFVALSDDEED